MSKKHKVVVCDAIHESGLELLKNDTEIDLVDASKVDKVALLDVIADADTVITRSSTEVNSTFLGAVKNLKAIVRAGVGVDNVDIDGCSKKGIIVMNVPTANTIAAVELTMAHMLSCMRSFPYAHNHLKQDRVWKREKWYGYELKGKKLGIIGFGNIGSRVGIRAKAFEMEVLAYDPYIDPTKATDKGVEYTTNFDDILACDVITIHTPKNKETINMISHDEVAKLKDGSVLINCARGGLYNEEALENGLKSGKIRFAGIDVFAKEPSTDHPLLELDNITVTPHLGANTHESQYKIATQAAKQAIEAVKGIAYPNALNVTNQGNVPKHISPYIELTHKIAFIASQLNKGQVKSIKIKASGEIAKYQESLETPAIVGTLSESLQEKINYVNAKFIADEREIKIESVEEKESGFTNKVTVKLTTTKDVISISATIFENDKPRIVDINGFELDINPDGKMILFKNSDVPGVIGSLGNVLANHNINIADFRLGRNDNHQAMAVIHIDEEINKNILAELEQLEACISVSYVSVV
jgi:D-3-phosphoglycerate dehydrogenase